MVEWVQPSYTLAAILKEYGNDLHNFFKKYNSDESGPYGIRSDVINTFVRSCGKIKKRFKTKKNVNLIFNSQKSWILCYYIYFMCWR